MILKTHAEFRESILHAAQQGKVEEHHFVYVDAFFERVSEASMKLMAEYGIGMSERQRALFEEGRVDYLKKILNLYPDVSEGYARHYGGDFLKTCSQEVVSSNSLVIISNSLQHRTLRVVDNFNSHIQFCVE